HTPHDNYMLLSSFPTRRASDLVRDGKATVAGLGPILPQDVMARAAADQKPYRQIKDIVYGRKYGTALTLDVVTPTHGANGAAVIDRKSTRLNSSHGSISYAVFC